MTAFLDLTEGEYGIPDRTCPSPATMTRILDRIDELLAAGEVVYVHCLAGIGRTGTVVGCWLVRHGTSGDDALATVERAPRRAARDARAAAARPRVALVRTPRPREV